MVGVLFLAIFCYLINQQLFGFYRKRHSFFSKRKMNLLYLYHIIFFAVYFTYAHFNNSDSHRYYEVLRLHEGDWFELFETGTKFIHFLSYPLYKIGFSYDMLMFTFSWFGYLGFLYAYLFFRENIPVKVKMFRSIDLLTLILFFPNMHFWTASLGKGAPIFLGLMMFAYAILKPKSRLGILILAGLIIYYIRPHVFMFVAVGTVLGYMSGREKIPLGRKLFIFISLVGVLLLVQDQILAVVNLQESENMIEDFENFTEGRSEELSSAGSGVNMSQYPLPFKLFTFWFRPLFIDAPNILGIITSFENLIYLLLFIKIINKDFVRFIRKSPSLVKMSFLVFFSTSFAMTFVMSNLGIIMRQKSMVMYFLFFVIYYYLAQKKYTRLLKIRRIRKLMKKESQMIVT